VYGGTAASADATGPVVYAHSFDYERWRSLGAPVLPAPRDYALFLDEDIVHHSDYARFGLQPPVSEAAYYPAINRYFDAYQRATGLPVYVAVHPRARYGARPQLWGDRTLLHGQTPQAVAVLANKPVAHLVSDELLQSFMGPQILGVSQLLDTRLVNIDSFSPQDASGSVGQVDEVRYGVYRNLYLKADGSSQAPLWTIIADAMDQAVVGRT
jgi:hypothetical protein